MPNPRNPYSDSLLADALLGSLSNAESLARGFAVAPVGLLGDINALGREYITPRLPRQIQSLLETAPSAPTTEQILANIPRASQRRMETSGMEQLGAAMNPMGPIELANVGAKGVVGAGRIAGQEITDVLSGAPARSLLGEITPKSMQMDVWHGSPHGPFTNFDPTKIGSGEGAQAFSYGHYLGEARGTGEEYRRMLSTKVDVDGKPLYDANKIVGSTGNKDLDDYLVANLGDVTATRKNLLDDIKYVAEGNPEAARDMQKTLDQLDKLKVDKQEAGYLYKVDLPDEAIANMLDWDKPLSKQPNVMNALRLEAEQRIRANKLADIENDIRSSLPAQNIGDDYLSMFSEANVGINQDIQRQALEKLNKMDLNPLIDKELDNMKPVDMNWNMTGKEFYELLSKREGSPEKASGLLQRQGVPGTRYLDQQSRTPGGSDTSNFVVYPGGENFLTIKEINDKPVGGLLGQSKAASAFDVSRRDASDIFGAGAERVIYKDPKSGGTMEVLAKPDGTASVLNLEVPETSRGKGIGQSLQAQVMQDYPEMMGQVSSKAAAKTAYRLGRRPPFNPDATLEDVYKMMDEDSSVNLVSPEMQKRFVQNEGLLGQSKAAEATDLLSYRGSHTAPSPEFGAPLHDLTGGGQMYPADVYSPKAAQYYGTGYPKADKEAFALANKVRGNPEAEVTMYRAVPKNESIKDINAGDWVTLSKDYAKNHGEAVLDNDYKIISKKVKAKDLWTNADSIHEFGYWPE